MTYSLPSIVVVDNDEAELNTIKNAFFAGGIPCLPINYLNEPGNESGIDHAVFSDGLNPRILVLDLNLTEMQATNPINLVGPLAEVIKKLPVTGPYLLCIWSKHDRDVDEVISLLQKRYADDITMPIQYSVISKTELMSEPASLKSKVEGLISANPLFDCILTWESRISEAARKTTNALFKLADNTQTESSISGCKEQLQKILATIGNEAIGSIHAQKKPSLAMDTGLAPVLEDQLLEILEDELDSKWKAALPELGQRIELENDIKAKLNTFFHIEEVDDDFPRDHRGVFVKLDMNYIQANSEKFKRRLGRTLKALIHEEFVSSKNNTSNQRAEIRDRLILGFLEVSAACDHAQKKIKLPKYIMGVLIPEQYDEHTKFDERPTSHDGIYRLPNIIYKNNPYILKFSFKYQIGAQPDDHKWFIEPLFRVREQILSEIIFNSSQYSSRPGIISFR